MNLAQGTLHIKDQEPHSVRLIKIFNSSIPPNSPTVSVQVPTQADIGAPVHVMAVVGDDSTPALAYHWDFGDGVSAEGPSVDHAYTRNGSYKVLLTVEGLNGVLATQSSSITIRGLIKTTYDVEHARRYKP